MDPLFASKILNVETIDVHLQRRPSRPGNPLRVVRGVVTCLLCAIVKGAPLLGRLMFAWE